ncbi:MAG: hypothetical protein QXK37_02820 [Candidatus Woesearchaeota archaeon]
MDKKGAIRWIDQWAEVLSIAIMILGLIFALLSDSAVITYTIMVLCGFVVGRTAYVRRSRIGFPFYMITFFFLVGFIVGTQLNRRGEPGIVVVTFIIGIYIGYSVYKRGLLK